MIIFKLMLYGVTGLGAIAVIIGGAFLLSMWEDKSRKKSYDKRRKKDELKQQKIGAMTDAERQVLRDKRIRNQKIKDKIGTVVSIIVVVLVCVSVGYGLIG